MSVGTSHVAGLRRSITETGPRPWDLQMVLVSEVVHRFLEPCLSNHERIGGATIPRRGGQVLASCHPVINWAYDESTLKPRNITTNSSLSAVGGVSRQSRARIPEVGCQTVTTLLGDRHFKARETQSSEVASRRRTLPRKFTSIMKAMNPPCLMANKIEGFPAAIFGDWGMPALVLRLRIGSLFGLDYMEAGMREWLK
ncbi:uncharacterized protein BDCG_06873 [Blastomyces dermatitidis ER-3]|uniref:Uncharacterized protein n=1 Tax=Ajellomyces dermatitidis (strain ER-3 / ATCC MYA-2586) TaxID=559297 RepID=A0ABP2F475_AJEDR|nr:uncharacterized protein BDCG_06873 [Blastomyces dermatitidis ER-3]EEQ91753.2 hypothetical protein BDCG_06873 [Blastomyces dermatitidis ER-3]